MWLIVSICLLLCGSRPPGGGEEGTRTMAQEPLCFASMKVFGWQGFRGALVTFLLFVRESGLGCLDLVRGPTIEVFLTATEAS